MPNTSGVLFDNVAVKGGEVGPPIGAKCCALAGIEVAAITSSIAAKLFMVRLFVREQCW